VQHTNLEKLKERTTGKLTGLSIAQDCAPPPEMLPSVPLPTNPNEASSVGKSRIAAPEGATRGLLSNSQLRNQLKWWSMRLFHCEPEHLAPFVKQEIQHLLEVAPQALVNYVLSQDAHSNPNICEDDGQTLCECLSPGALAHADSLPASVDSAAL